LNSSYTQDVEFNSAFGALQTPAHIYTAAVICGVRAPRIDAPFRFLDLACGNGLTASLMADAYPHAEFVGIDINPAHIRKAKERAAAAELTNIRFFEGDIRDLVSQDYEPFDYCAVGGVYSWLDADRRNAMRSFLSSIIRPGGLVYLDYSAQPGMAQAAPLYRILREFGSGFQGSSGNRLSAAANFVHELQTQGARFFQANPIAAARLETILRNSANDEAHEVFNLQENGLWSSDVISGMEESSFEFIANAGLHHNLVSLSSRPNILASAADLPRPQKELVFDIVWNVHQRKDIYVRNGAPTHSEPLSAMLVEQPLYVMADAVTPAQRQKLKKLFPHFDFCSPEANLLADSAPNVDTFGELFIVLREKGVSEDAANDLMRHFLAARLISVAASLPRSARKTDAIEISSRLNRFILMEDIAEQFARPFASPVIGSRVLLPLKDRLYIWALVGLDLSEAWARLGDMREILREANNNAVTWETFVHTIEQNLPLYRTFAVPELVRLGILRYR